MKFRLTIGENGSAFGKQKVLCEGEAKNAIEFVKSILKYLAPDAAIYLIDNAWVDAGNDTIPIAVANLKLF